MDRRGIIVGGGIGGLAAALGLARIGIGCVVLERAPEFGEIGAGIQLGPNAFHAFDYLGIGEAAREQAVFIDHLKLMDAVSGDELTSVSLGAEFRKHFGNPYAVVHRANLHSVLYNACARGEFVELRKGQLVTGYERTAGGVAAIVAGGERIEGTVLIGADGLWSTIRRQLLGDDAAVVSGHTTYRSVIPTERMPADLQWNAATLWAGPKCHLVHYPLVGGQFFNLVVTADNGASEIVVGEPVASEEVHRWFSHIHPRARKIIEHGREWKRWVLCDREPVETWTDGQVALLGDAAHPMLQYFAQGACMALEDAVCLSHMLEHYDAVEEALRAYQDARVPRAARVQLSSRLIGEYIYHPAGARARVRDSILKSWSQEEMYHRLNWIYGGNGITNPS